LRAEDASGARVTGVLVREEDVGQLADVEPRALAPARRLAQREPGVDQDARRARVTQRELPPLPLDRTHRRTERM